LDDVSVDLETLADAAVDMAFGVNEVFNSDVEGLIERTNREPRVPRGS